MTLRDIGQFIVRGVNAVLDTNFANAGTGLIQVASYAIGAALVLGVLAALFAAHRNQAAASSRAIAQADTGVT